MTSPDRSARPAPRRIHIIGDQGSGKTTLASRLGERLAIPVHHLDEVARDEAGRDRDPVVLLEAAEAIAASPAWITEGLHLGWTGPLFEHAERVVWLDTVGRVGAAIRITRRFVAGAAAETRRRGWRGLLRFRDYARHANGLGQTMVRISRSGRVAVRDAEGRARPGELDRFIAAHPERLVHCRTRDDVDRLVAGLVPVGLPAARREAAVSDGEPGHAASREPGGEDREHARTGGPNDERAAGESGQVVDAIHVEASGPAARAGLRGNVHRGRSELLTHLRDPLFWHAYVLLANTAITSALGLIYWFLVARLFPQEQVGRNAAVIASITLVAGAAQLNLRPVLARLVPIAGRRTSELLILAYGATTMAAIVFSTGYLLAGPLWISEGPLLEIHDHPALAAAFVVAAVLWTQFAIQDGALIGFRRTVLLAIENAAFSVGKILLLVLFAIAAAGGDLAIVLSWALPIAVAVAVVTGLIAVRLVPQHVARRFTIDTPLSMGRMVRYAAGDYAGSLFALAFSSMVPVIVLSQAGAEASARFYIVWVITTSLMLIAPQMLTSLVVDTARDPSTFTVQGRRMLIGILRVLVPAVAAIVIGAPLILAVFGPAYAEEEMLLRLLATSVVPFAVINLYVSLARVRTQPGRIVLVQGTVASVLLVAVLALLPRAGLNGVGWAFLGTFGTAAIVLLATALRPLLTTRGIRPETR